jgi:hypothetical protein
VLRKTREPSRLSPSLGNFEPWSITPGRRFFSELQDFSCEKESYFVPKSIETVLLVNGGFF